MPLETQQSLHNVYQFNAKNVSASNDQYQAKHDMNEMLINGAKVADAGRAAGLNDGQTLDLVSRQMARDEIVDTNRPQRQLIQKSHTNLADEGILREIGKRRNRR